MYVKEEQNTIIDPFLLENEGFPLWLIKFRITLKNFLSFSSVPSFGL